METLCNGALMWGKMLDNEERETGRRRLLELSMTKEFKNRMVPSTMEKKHKFLNETVS